MKKILEVVSAAGPLVVLLLLVLFVISGCAGSIGWSAPQSLPRGSFNEERIDRVGPRSDGPCSGGMSRSAYEIPAGYELVPMNTATRSPCQ